MKLISIKKAYKIDFRYSTITPSDDDQDGHAKNSRIHTPS